MKMDNVMSSLNPGAVIGGFVLVMAFLALGILHRRNRKSNESKSLPYPKDVVILHQGSRAPYAPSLSPFAVKLETYLRVAKIPYQNVYDKKPGSKGKIPWIEYNGVSVPDTEFCMQFLRQKRSTDINEELTPEQQATARAFQKMVDEHTYWIMILFRWIYDETKEVINLAKWRRTYITIVTYMARMQTHYQGLGRHTQKEVEAILDGDFKALSQYLGDKQYFFGDSPTEVDCALFGQLSQLLWHLPHTIVPTLLQEKYPNLVDYCERIQTNYWPDWSSCITHGDRQSDRDQKCG
ncbi:failed axon connections homolog [Mizuhopecten yessoensis]|uniref:Failed axon connections-like n=1 Tax=Mizuhopecten yessoensis TaxID=6573 RepID=A0A210QYK6_MIZYE|nr:failed axon connections homolog [Mizuhopecten yessoensis]OWF53863.1 Failed axon connections-like [Mizuhopecten yessoensis]